MRTRGSAALFALFAFPAWRNQSHAMRSVPTGLSAGGEAAILGVAALVLFGLAVLVGWRLALSRARGRRGPGQPRGQPPGQPPTSPPGTPTTELEARASHVLVDTDDAIRTSEQELGFATARFGERSAAPFSAAVKSARSELAEAFRLRQLLDEGSPESESVRRSYLARISTHCGEASKLLDEQSEAFDRLQNLEARAPELTAEVLAHTAQQSARVVHSREMIDHLAAKYTRQAVAAVASSPDQAARRLQFATDSLAAAHQAMAGDQRGDAAAFLQAAESAADQASDLLDSIKHLDSELTQAASALAVALREIDTDIAEGDALLVSRPEEERASLVATAQAEAAEVRDLLAAGPFDALSALRALELAAAALDQALAGARPDRVREERARAALDQSMLVARSSVTAAEDFVATRRGAVGVAARTRLAEAHRHYRQVIGSGRYDPEAALADAQRADALAREASSLAEQDVRQFGDGEPGAAGRAGFGRASLDAVLSAIIGGILIDSLPDGERTGAHPDITGVAGVAGGPGPGGTSPGRSSPGPGVAPGILGPGSFGGIGTRARHSIAGSTQPDRPGNDKVGSERASGSPR